MGVYCQLIRSCHIIVIAIGIHHHRLALDPETIADTLGTLLKYQEDIARIQGSDGEKLLSEVKAELLAKAG